MTKLKIAVVAACPFPFSRGTPVRILRMAQAVAKQGPDVHVVTYHLGEDTPTPELTIQRIADLPTYNKTTPGPSYQKLLLVDTLLAKKLRQVLNEGNFDLIHAHHYEGLITALRAGHDLPIIYDAHTLLKTELYHYNLALPKILKQRIGDWFDNQMPQRADHIISVSDEITQQLLKYPNFEIADITTMPGGIELAHFKVAAQKTADKSGKKIIGFAGNFAEYQGINYLLEAFQKVLATRKDIELHLISEADFGGYEKLADTLGIRGQIKLIVAGFETLPQHLANADILLNPRAEGAGYPLKILNYMAASKPIVSFAGSARDIKHKELGWVVENKDTQAFADGISHLLDNPGMAAQLGKNARAFVEKEFSWDTTGVKLVELYQKIISAKHKTGE